MWAGQKEKWANNGTDQQRRGGSLRTSSRRWRRLNGGGDDGGGDGVRVIVGGGDGEREKGWSGVLKIERWEIVEVSKVEKEGKRWQRKMQRQKLYAKEHGGMGQWSAKHT
ncbi:hypothetical protein NL676_011895 [Syzygium grande]|nr:hypothetical protein NL676_011895 [Syzygium grande]